jgi:hypothetical protein
MLILIKLDITFLGKMLGVWTTFISNHLIWEMKLRKELLPVSIFYEDLKYSGCSNFLGVCIPTVIETKHEFLCVYRYTFEPPSEQQMTAYDATPSHLSPLKTAPFRHSAQIDCVYITAAQLRRVQRSDLLLRMYVL